MNSLWIIDIMELRYTIYGFIKVHNILYPRGVKRLN